MTDLHGGAVFAAARELGRPWEDILDFSANINPLGFPPGLGEHLFSLFEQVKHYPDPLAEAWRRELGDRLGLDPGLIIPGNGTTPLMHLLVRVIRPQRPVIVIPAFAEYDQALTRAGITPLMTACRPEDDFDLTSEALDRVFSLRPDLVFLANPTSPAGRVLDRGLLEKVFFLAEKNNAWIVLDEAFIDFTRAPSLANRVVEYPRLMVLRSLTKIFSLPGLRLGYMTVPPSLAGLFWEVVEPWSLNVLALAAGTYCLDQDEFTARTRDMVAGERTWLSERLGFLGRTTPGEANYLLVKLEQPGWTVPDLAAGLRKNGVLIRDCASFQGVLQGYFRTAVKTRAENMVLVETARRVISGG
ncbi:MAG: threonine-phosphate decarboxylase [Pseudomonadota bacterium]